MRSVPKTTMSSSMSACLGAFRKLFPDGRVRISAEVILGVLFLLARAEAVMIGSMACTHAKAVPPAQVPPHREERSALFCSHIQRSEEGGIMGVPDASH